MRLVLASALVDVHHRIEAKRLVSNLGAKCLQIFGTEHNLTKRAQDLLNRMKECVILLPPYFEKFEAVRYENDCQILVVQGPITEPRNVKNEEEFTVESCSVWPAIGGIVACHGLKNASHLNGKIGDIRSPPQECGDVYRFAVHFEDKSLKPALVKPENLRVVFDLPDPTNE